MFPGTHQRFARLCRRDAWQMSPAIATRLMKLRQMMRFKTLWHFTCTTADIIRRIWTRKLTRYNRVTTKMFIWLFIHCITLFVSILIYLDTKEDNYLRGTTGSKVSGMATYSQMSDRSSATKIISKFILFSIFLFFYFFWQSLLIFFFFPVVIQRLFARSIASWLTIQANALGYSLTSFLFTLFSLKT